MSEKTEQPTHKKLQDLRRKGNVPKSKDFSKALMLTAFSVYLMFATPHLFGLIVAFLFKLGELAYQPFDTAMPIALNLAGELMMESIIPLVVMVILVDIFSEVIQSGVIFSGEKVKLNFENIDPIKRAMQMFSARNLIEFVKSILKVVLMTSVVYVLIRSNLGDLARLSAHSTVAIFDTLGRMLMALMVAATIIFLVFGGPDLLLQKLLFLRENKMSKDEVFREYKESEGDPHLNAHRKQIHRELAAGGGGAKKASAVVVNPTHVAVALYYDKSEVPLPIVLAKGEDETARDIVREARENGIPIIRNIPVARALLADAEVDEFIPTWLLEPVAELLRTVAELAAEGPVDQAEMD